VYKGVGEIDHGQLNERIQQREKERTEWDKKSEKVAMCPRSPREEGEIRQFREGSGVIWTRESWRSTYTLDRSDGWVETARRETPKK
jgi:hypothetical protein